MNNPKWRSLAGTATGWLAVSGLWAALLTGAFARLNALGTGDLPALFAFWLAVYAPFTLSGAACALALLIARARVADGHGFGRGLAVGLGGSAALLLVLNLFARWVPAYRAVWPPAMRKLLPIGLLDWTALALGFAGLVLASERLTARGGRRSGALWLSAALALLLATHAFNVAYEQPSRVDLAAEVAPLVGPHPACQPQPAPARRMLLLALDGMTWSVVRPLLAQGRMPNLERVLAMGAYGHLDPLFPSYSPVVWSTIATGLPEDAHGVHGFLETRLPGVSRPISRGPLLNSFVWWGAADTLMNFLSGHGIGSSGPVASGRRRGHALWNVADADHRSVGVFDWMNTWPVEKVAGYMVTLSGGKRARAYPLDRVAAALEGVADTPVEAPRDASLAKFHSRFTDAFALYRAFAPDVSFHFNKVMDDSHEHWTDPARYWVSPLRFPYGSFRDVVEESYTLSDAWIGQFWDARPEDAIFVVVSDHGYEFNGTHHAFSPPGVIVLAGGPFACGRVIEGADILDVAPTLLAALGLPGLDAMPGSVLKQAFADSPAPRLAREHTYPADWRKPLDAEPVGEDEDWDELRARLKAIGYDR